MFARPGCRDLDVTINSLDFRIPLESATSSCNHDLYKGAEMKFLFVTATFAGLALGSTASFGQSCEFYLPNGECGPAVTAPDANAGLKNNPDLLTIRVPQKAVLVKDALYTVNLTCNRVAYNTVNNPWGLFVNKQRTTSHIIAITNQRLASNQLPSDARATVAVYSVSDGTQNSNTFINDGCNISFVLSGKDSAFLAATTNQSDTNTPGVLTNAIFDFVKLTLSVVPLFTGTTFASHWAPSFNQAVADQPTLANIFTQLDKGNTVTKAADLYEGKTTITTPYSSVDIVISRIKSLIDLHNDRFTSDFEKVVETAKPNLKLDTLSGDGLDSQCAGFAGDLLSRNFSTTDVAYALAYATLLFGLDKEKTLTCLGSNYALPALNHQALWTKFNSKGAPYNAVDVKTRFQDDDAAKPAQPAFSKVQDNPLQHAQAALGAYLQLSPNQITPAVTNALAKYFSSAFVIEDLSDIGFDDGAVAPDQFAMKVAIAAKHVGCLTSDTEAVAVFFAFKGAGTNGQYSPTDAVAIRVWVDEYRKIAWAKLTADDAASLLEKALQARSSRTCGTVTVAAPAKP